MTQRAALDEALVAECTNLRAGLIEAGDNLAKAKQIIDKYMAMPLYPATFLRYDSIGAHGRIALVSSSGSIRAVALSEDVAGQSLQRGDEVYLGNEQSVIVDIVGSQSLGGDYAQIDRILSDRRLILNGRGEEKLIADPAGSLDPDSLRPGDCVRFDRASHVVRERIEDAASHTKFQVYEVPDLSLSAVAGDEGNLGRVLDALEISLLDPKLRRLYDLDGSSTILLWGPPGCGKTLISQVACSEISRRAGRRAFFCVVQASSFENPYVGATQQAIRECFASLREASEQGPAVLFLDEIESMGRVRGGMVDHHSDKFLASLLAEIDGFTRLKNVAVIAASNRKDLLDSALLGRLAAQIHVRRPSLRSARAIMGVHLPETLPFCPNGASASATRSDAIDKAITMLYAPNAGGQLATLKFGDGRTRVITANEMVSGRLLKQVCGAAKKAAFHRETSTGVRGVQPADIEAAVSEALEQMATSLSPQNAHHYLDDLASDEIVVSVAPHTTRVPNRRRYLAQR